MFKITAFMLAINFLVVGTYIAYYKSVVKVDTIKQICQTTFFCLIAYLVIGIVHTIFVVVFAFMEDIEDNLEDPTIY